MDDRQSIRLLLVSRHALTRGALAHLLQARPGLEVVGEAGTRLHALTQAAQHAPDIILLEPHPETDVWLDAIDALATASGPHARVLVLTSLTDPDIPRQALRQGAKGLLDLEQPPETLVKAIHTVHGGDVWVERRLMAELLTAVSNGSGSDRARIETLTPRERDVVRLVSEGLKNKQIAERLSVADVTVRHHLTSIYSKVGVGNRQKLMLYAFEHGIVRPPGGQGA